MLTTSFGQGGRAKPPQPPPRVDYGAIRISIPLLPPAILRGNSARSKRDYDYRMAARGWALLWEEAVRNWLRKRGWPVQGLIDPAEAVVIFVVPDKRRRDGENFIRACKPIWDMMCGYPVKGQITRPACRLLYADDYHHLTVQAAQFVVDKAEAPQTIIELRRVSGNHP